MVLCGLLIVHLHPFSSAEYPAKSHLVRDTRVKAKSGQYRTCFSVMSLEVLPFGMDTCKSPIAVAVKRVWSAALIGFGGISFIDMKQARFGDMCDDVPESYTSTSRLERGLVLHAKVAPVNGIVKENSLLPVVALADSFPLESSFFFP